MASNWNKLMINFYWMKDIHEDFKSERGVFCCQRSGQVPSLSMMDMFNPPVISSWTSSSPHCLRSPASPQNIQSDISGSGKILYQILTSVIAPWWGATHTSFIKTIFQWMVLLKNFTFDIVRKTMAEIQLCQELRKRMRHGWTWTCQFILKN